MSKKRNRQPDANPEHSEGSTESCDESSTASPLGEIINACAIGGSCPHIARALNLSKIKKNIKKGGISTECVGCKKKDDASAVKEKEEDQANSQPGIWICLQCGNQGCGRDKNGHAMEHFKKPFSDCHALVVHTLQWTVWCYQCEIEINSAYRKKLLETVMVVKKLASMPIPPTHANSMQLQQSLLSTQQYLQNGIEGSQDSTNKDSSEFPKVVGLTNLGNTCFFNAVLQCLAQTPYLVKVLEDLKNPGQTFVLPGGKHKPSDASAEIEMPPIEGTLEGWGNFTSILWKTLTEMQDSKQRRTFNPSELLNSFKKKTMQCMDGGQHDSHELLRHLLEIVRNEDLRRYQSIILKEVGLNGKTNPDGVEDSLKSRVKFYGNQASARLLGPEPVFRGVLVSTLECLDCHHVSMRTEPFLDLSLPVMAAKPQPPHFKIPPKKEIDSSMLITDNLTAASSRLRRKKMSDELYSGKSEPQREKRDSFTNSEAAQTPAAQMNGTSLEVDLDESDADVEDNVDLESLLAEVAESGYSSEKASALASPISHHSSQASAKATNVIPNGFPVSKISDYQPVSPRSIAEVSTCEATDYLTTCLSRTNISAEPIASAGSPDNDALTQSGSLPTSLAVHSDLTSPEWPPASLSSFPSPEKDSPSPCSPCSSPSPASPAQKIRTSPNESDSCSSFNLPSQPLHYCQPSFAIPLPPPNSSFDSKNVLKLESETLQLNSTPGADEGDENSFEKKLRKEEDETEKQMLNGEKPEVEKQASQELQAEVIDSQNDSRKERRKPESPLKEKTTETNNGVNSSMLKTSDETHIYHSPTRYPTKEGECSVESCLNQFTALELMSGSNKVGCESCTARERKVKGDCKMVCTPSTKQYLISEVPPVLILNLKRCQAQRFDFRKVTKHVSFPMVLDLAPVCKDHRKSRVYALYGVVEHSGTMHGGHYVAYVKARLPLAPDDSRWSYLPAKEVKDAEENRQGGISSTSSVPGSRTASDSEDEEPRKPIAAEPPSGKWYHVSDSRVSEVDERTVLQSQAYLLFYERIL